jgi:hypothetical protein
MENEMFNDSKICDTVQIGRKDKASNKKEARQHSRKTIQQALSLLLTIAGIMQTDEPANEQKKSVKDRASKKKHWKTKRSNARDAKAHQADGEESSLDDDWEGYFEYPQGSIEWMLCGYNGRPKDFFAAKTTLEWILPQLTDEDHNLWESYLRDPLDYDWYYYTPIWEWICKKTIGRNEYRKMEDHLEMPTKEAVFAQLMAIISEFRYRELVPE